MEWLAGRCWLSRTTGGEQVHSQLSVSSRLTAGATSNTTGTNQYSTTNIHQHCRVRGRKTVQSRHWPPSTSLTKTPATRATLLLVLLLLRLLQQWRQWEREAASYSPECLFSWQVTCCLPVETPGIRNGRGLNKTKTKGSHYWQRTVEMWQNVSQWNDDCWGSEVKKQQQTQRVSYFNSTRGGARESRTLTGTGSGGSCEIWDHFQFHINNRRILFAWTRDRRYRLWTRKDCGFIFCITTFLLGNYTSLKYNFQANCWNFRHLG